MRFANRKQAGQELAQALEKYSGESQIIYALPRGGVVLGTEVAEYLHSPLDLIIVRKIGHPMNPEFAIAALTEEGDLIYTGGDSEEGWMEEQILQQKNEIERRRRLYSGTHRKVSPKGKCAIIVDDGIATGLTMRAAVRSIRSFQPREIVIAVPVAPPDVVMMLKKEVDEIIVLVDPKKGYLGAVGAYFDSFPQVSDDEVIDLLKTRGYGV